MVKNMARAERGRHAGGAVAGPSTEEDLFQTKVAAKDYRCQISEKRPWRCYSAMLL